MVETTLARRSGTRISQSAFDHQLGLRGITQRELARRAGLHEVIVSRARRGHPVTASTLRKIVNALLATPLLIGADLLLVENETAGGAASPAISKGVLGASDTATSARG